MSNKIYNGKLSVSKAAEGIKTINENAESLLFEAELLLKNKRFERAATLAILAIEESGKVSIIRQILLEDNEKELKKEWKRFRTHGEKNWALIFLNFPVSENTKLEDFLPAFDARTSKGREFDNLKQTAFYTDLFQNGEWWSPKMKITEALSRNIIRTANLFVGKDLNAMSTLPELELWIKHMKPVWKKDMELMKVALSNCYKEAEQLGVLSGSRKAEELIAFI